MKTILFAPHYSASLMTLIKIADKHEEKKFRPLFFISKNVTDPERCLGILRENNYEYILESDLLSDMKINIFFQELIVRPKKYIRFLKNENVMIIISANDGNMYLLKAAKVLGIKTIGIQWADTGPVNCLDRLDSERRQQYYQGKYGRSLAKLLELKFQVQFKLKQIIYKIFGYRISRFFTDGMSDYFCLMGPYYAEMLNRQGTPLEKLIITGHPEHDYLFNLKKISSNEYITKIKNSFGLDPNKKLIVLGREAIRFFDLIPVEKDRQDMREVFDILREYTHEAEIFMKAHPRDEIDYYDFIKDEYPFARIYHDNIDFYSLIASCNLYISQISSTMNWAIALDIPTISYDFNRIESWDYIRNRKGLIYANTPEQLREVVKRYFKSPSNIIFNNMAEAREMYMRLDGKALERILTLAGCHRLPN